MQATITPLSSIFGSGFLVIVPILAGAVGGYSVAAMAVVCAIAYAVGSAIRYNITHAEPALASRAFAFYYLLQCLVAIAVSKSTTQRLAMGAIAVILAFITIFAVPAG